MRTELNKIVHLGPFKALAETLGHTFTLNGTLYADILTQVMVDWEESTMMIAEYFTKSSVLRRIYHAIELWPINAGEDSYTHTALQILKSLNKLPPTKNLGWTGHLLAISALLQAIIIIDNGYIHVSQYARKLMGRVIKSGKVSKFRRELRLKNLQPGIT